MLQDDIKNLSPNLIEEKNYLESEISQLSKNKSNYFKDPWNIIDVTAYLLILFLVILHVTDIAVHSTSLAQWVARYYSNVVYYGNYRS